MAIAFHTQYCVFAFLLLYLAVIIPLQLTVTVRGSTPLNPPSPEIPNTRDGSVAVTISTNTNLTCDLEQWQWSSTDTALGAPTPEYAVRIEVDVYNIPQVVFTVKMGKHSHNNNNDNSNITYRIELGSDHDACDGSTWPTEDEKWIRQETDSSDELAQCTVVYEFRRTLQEHVDDPRVRKELHGENRVTMEADVYASYAMQQIDDNGEVYCSSVQFMTTLSVEVALQGDAAASFDGQGGAIVRQNRIRTLDGGELEVELVVTLLTMGRLHSFEFVDSFPTTSIEFKIVSQTNNEASEDCGLTSDSPACNYVLLLQSTEAHNDYSGTYRFAARYDNEMSETTNVPVMIWFSLSYVIPTPPGNSTVNIHTSASLYSAQFKEPKDNFTTSDEVWVLVETTPRLLIPFIQIGVRDAFVCCMKDGIPPPSFAPGHTGCSVHNPNLMQLWAHLINNYDTNPKYSDSGFEATPQSLPLVTDKSGVSFSLRPLQSLALNSTGKALGCYVHIQAAFQSMLNEDRTTTTATVITQHDTTEPVFTSSVANKSPASKASDISLMEYQGCYFAHDKVQCVNHEHMISFATFALEPPQTVAEPFALPAIIFISAAVVGTSIGICLLIFLLLIVIAAILQRMALSKNDGNRYVVLGIPEGTPIHMHILEHCRAHYLYLSCVIPPQYSQHSFSRLQRIIVACTAVFIIVTGNAFATGIIGGSTVPLWPIGTIISPIFSVLFTMIMQLLFSHTTNTRLYLWTKNSEKPPKRKQISSPQAAHPSPPSQISPVPLRRTLSARKEAKDLATAEVALNISTSTAPNIIATTTTTTTDAVTSQHNATNASPSADYVLVTKKKSPPLNDESDAESALSGLSKSSHEQNRHSLPKHIHQPLPSWAAIIHYAVCAIINCLCIIATLVSSTSLLSGFAEPFSLWMFLVGVLVSLIIDAIVLRSIWLAITGIFAMIWRKTHSKIEVEKEQQSAIANDMTEATEKALSTPSKSALRRSSMKFLFSPITARRMSGSMSYATPRMPYDANGNSPGKMAIPRRRSIKLHRDVTKVLRDMPSSYSEDDNVPLKNTDTLIEELLEEADPLLNIIAENNCDAFEAFMQDIEDSVQAVDNDDADSDDLDDDDIDIEAQITHRQAIIQEKQLEVLQRTYSQHNGNTPLHLAALLDRHELIDKMMSYGPSIERMNKFQATPLHLACSKGNRESVMALVSNGADVSARDMYGYLPFHIAIKMGYTQVADDLFIFGVDVNSKTTGSKTALHVACESGWVNSIQYLLDKGAKVNIRDQRGNTPLFLAVLSNQVNVLNYFSTLPSFSKDLMAKQKDSGSNILHCCVDWSLFGMIVVLSRVASVEQFTTLLTGCDLYRGRTPLHYAVTQHKREMTELLLSFTNCDPNILDKRDQTCLHLILGKPDDEIDEEILLLLLKCPTVRLDVMGVVQASSHPRNQSMMSKPSTPRSGLNKQWMTAKQMLKKSPRFKHLLSEIDKLRSAPCQDIPVGKNTIRITVEEEPGSDISQDFSENVITE